MKKENFLLSCMLFLISSSTTSQTTYPSLIFSCEPSHEHYAREWISPLFDSQSWLHSSEADLQIILNILYFSCARSQATQQAQRTTLDAMQKLWRGWQNITQRRRNPSKPIPYSHATDNITHVTALHEKNLIMHEAISTIYETALEQVIKGEVLENGFLKNHLVFVRDQARSVTIAAMIDVKMHLQSLLEYLNQTRALAFDNDEEETLRSCFTEYLTDNIPACTMRSFTLADNLFIKVSDYNWSTLNGAQELSVLIWNAIENARGPFYYTLYAIAYAQAEARGIQPIVVFNKKGLLPVNKRKMLLPAPHSQTETSF